MNIELGKLKEWLNVNKLSLNVAKTEFMVIGSRQRLATFDDREINVFVGNDQIERVNSSKSVGLITDENLTWKSHIDEISNKISATISALKRIGSYISQDTAGRVYQGLIEPYFSYCASVWDSIGSKLSDKLQKNFKIEQHVLSHVLPVMLLLALYLKNLDGIIYILIVKCKKQFS